MCVKNNDDFGQVKFIKLENKRSLSHLVSTLVLKTGSFFDTKPLIIC